MKPNRTAELFEMVFEGRNREYGGYLLRKKYARYLLISTLSGILFFTALVVAPFLYFYFEPSTLSNDDILTTVEYFSIMPPPENDLENLPGSLPREEVLQVPVVTDSIIREKLRPVETTPPDEHQEEPSDTAGKGAGNAVNGQGEGEAGGIVTVIDSYPKYPGGDEVRLWFLRKNIRYPDAALKAGIQGVVVVSFIIEKDGSLTDVAVSKAIGGGCDEEAIRVVRLMPKWEPARRNGQAVRVVVRMPIVFRMPGK